VSKCYMKKCIFREHQGVQCEIEQILAVFCELRRSDRILLKQKDCFANKLEPWTLNIVVQF
jgi:hypothetical protein